jgi:hypothetical protein
MAGPCAVFLMLSSGPVSADDVSNQMDEAKRLYENGRLADSVRELETAISGIRRGLSARLGSKMPPPPRPERLPTARCKRAAHQPIKLQRSGTTL